MWAEMEVLPRACEGKGREEHQKRSLQAQLHRTQVGRDLGCALGLGSTLQKEVLQQLNQEAPSRVRHHPAVGLRA